jgi:hypothetical protein
LEFFLQTGEDFPCPARGEDADRVGQVGAARDHIEVLYFRDIFGNVIRSQQQIAEPTIRREAEALMDLRPAQVAVQQ